MNNLVTDVEKINGIEVLDFVHINADSVDADCLDCDCPKSF